MLGTGGEAGGAGREKRVCGKEQAAQGTEQYLALMCLAASAGSVGRAGGLGPPPAALAAAAAALRPLRHWRGGQYLTIVLVLQFPHVSPPSSQSQDVSLSPGVSLL